MGNYDWSKWEAAFSFKLDKKSASRFHLCWKDNDNKTYGEADLKIEEAPPYLNKSLGRNDQLILICYNIKFFRGNYHHRLPSKLVIRVISKLLGECHNLNRKNKLAGVLFLLSEVAFESLNELQRHWLKDFSELFSFIDRIPEGFFRLYMPTNNESVFHYMALDTLLEKSMDSTTSGRQSIIVKNNVFSSEHVFSGHLYKSIEANIKPEVIPEEEW